MLDPVLPLLTGTGDHAEPITAGQRAIDGEAPPTWPPVIQSAVLSQVKPALNF